MEIRLSKWQSEVFDDTHRYKVINCGRRAGKSTLTAVEMIRFADDHPGSISWYVAPTYKQAKQIMWQMLAEIVPAHGIKKKNETELIIILRNGSSINLKGADNPDSLRGVRIDLVVFDECAFIQRWEEVWKVIRPTLADSQAKCWFISTPNGFNHFYDLSQKQGDDWIYYHFTSYDNPHIPKEEIDQARSEMSEDSFAQEWLGEFRKMSGLIYKTFDRNTHMVEIPDIQGYTHARAIDFGYGHNTALIYFAINTTGTAIYGYDGVYQQGLTIPDIASAIKIKDAGKRIQFSVADSAQPGYIEQLNREGLNFTPVEKGADSVTMGINKVASLLQTRADTGKPTLMFNKDLQWIAEEFEKYQWMENIAQGYIKESPLKRDDDAMDAIRYFAMTYKKEEEYRPLRNDISTKQWSIGL